MLEKISIERAFLILALIFGIALSVVMPVLHGHDQDYHFDRCCYLMDCVVDRESVDAGTRDNRQFMKYSKQGVKKYFEQYFVKEAPRLKQNQIKENLDGNFFARSIDKTYLLTVVPAIGVKIGSLIHHSVGVMCLCGRIVATIFYAVSLFFLIKMIKYGKLFLAMIALTPTMMNTSASLSYDNTIFVLVSLFVVLIINLSLSDHFPKKYLIPLVIDGFLLAFINKHDTIILLPLLLFLPYQKYQNLGQLRLHYQQVIYFVSKLKYLLGLLLVMIGGFLFWHHSEKVGGISFVIHKFLNTFIFYSGSRDVPTPLGLGYQVSSLVGGTLNHDLVDRNPVMPSWWVLLWFMIFFILVFSVQKIKETEQLIPLATGGTVIYFVHYFGTCLSLVNHGAYPIPYIGGPSGRYFTPMSSLFIPLVESCHLRVQGINQRLRQGIFIIFNASSLVLYLIIILEYMF